MRCSGVSEADSVMRTTSLATRRGAESDMCFSTLADIWPASNPFRCATSATVVNWQLASAVASRSVGLNVRPSPPLSLGASVLIWLLLGVCVQRQVS